MKTLFRMILILLLAFSAASIPALYAQNEQPASASASASRAFRFIRSGKIRYLDLRDVASSLGMRFAFTQKGGMLYGGDRKVEFTYKKKVGSIDGVEVYFCYPMLIQGGLAYLSELDFQMMIEPIFAKKAQLRRRHKFIMIDPGHGGSDPGAGSALGHEKLFNLQIARKLKRSLLHAGYSVAMTRDGDTFPTLAQRAALCAKVKPDLYISIHCNSSASKSTHGIETYVMTPSGAASTADSKPKYSAQKGNAYDDLSARLGYEIQKALIKTTGAEDRGLRHARFYVIANATCPAVLIECGYLSNAAELKKLANADYQERIVLGILSGLYRYGLYVK